MEKTKREKKYNHDIYREKEKLRDEWHTEMATIIHLFGDGLLHSMIKILELDETDEKSFTIFQKHCLKVK